MAFSSGDPIEYGKELADRTKSPWDFAGGNLMYSFKKRRDTDYEIEKLKERELYKHFLPPTEKDKAMQDYYKARAESLRGAEETRGIYLVNQRTGDIYKSGDKTRTPVDPSSVKQSDRIMSVNFPPQSGIEKMTSAEASIKQLEDLKNILISKKSNPFFKFTGEKTPVFGDEEAQRYNIIRKDFSDRLLRLRSGAQINEKEYTRLMGMLPQFWRNSDVDIEQLDKFKNEYVNLMNRISTGGLDNFESMSEEQQNPLMQGIQNTQQPEQSSNTDALVNKWKQKYGSK